MTPLPKTSAPAERALAEMGVTCLEDFAKFSEQEVASWHGVGPKVMRILSQALKEHNLSFKK